MAGRSRLVAEAASVAVGLLAGRLPRTAADAATEVGLMTLSRPQWWQRWRRDWADRRRRDRLRQRRPPTVAIMCNRYRSSAAWQELNQEFSETRLPLVFPTPAQAPNLEPRDIRPTDTAPVARPVDPSDPAAGLELVHLRWDLVPYFHKGPLKAKKYLCTNARSETVATTATFREAFKRRRLLGPGVGLLRMDRREGPQDHVGLQARAPARLLLRRPPRPR